MILYEIAEKTKKRVEGLKKQTPLHKVRARAEKLPADTGFPFAKALQGPEVAFICEVKKASPSKGMIAQDFPYRTIAREYEVAGAAAVSVLTEPYYFLGSDQYLQEIVQEVRIPVLCKDFIIDAYQIYEARCLGASAVLLICALLEDTILREYITIARSLGLSALVEAHDEKEIASAVRVGAEIIGVNNRNLKDFSVDFSNSTRLRELVPKDVLFVAESGIKTAKDVQTLREAGVNGVLIGETLMKSADKKAMLQALRGF